MPACVCCSPGIVRERQPTSCSMQLFTGEEIMHAVRLWTSGWDFFCPSENLVYHLYVTKEFGKTRPKFWDEVSGYLDAQVGLCAACPVLTPPLCHR